MKFDREPVFSTGTPGPWGVDSTSTGWYVVHKETRLGKRIGRVGGKGTNYFDRAIKEAMRRNDLSFEGRGVAMLKSLGARASDDYLLLDTKAGLVRSKVFADHWIAFRFEDVEKARLVLAHDDRLNRFSGKWNFMFGTFGEGDAELQISYVRHELEKIL